MRSKTGLALVTGTAGPPVEDRVAAPPPRTPVQQRPPRFASTLLSFVNRQFRATADDEHEEGNEESAPVCRSQARAWKTCQPARARHAAFSIRYSITTLATLTPVASWKARHCGA